MILRPAPSGPGLVIAGSSDERLLTTAGLQVGDRLLESDQVPIDPADAALVSEHFNSLDAVELTLQRDNRLRLITVDLTR
jgi:S1-C subfamily serine protease